MEEKVIREFRVIETEDGFRIEIKGDKERLREWVENLDPRAWSGRGKGWGPWMFGFGPKGFADFMAACGCAFDGEAFGSRRKRGETM